MSFRRARGLLLAIALTFSLLVIIQAHASSPRDVLSASASGLVSATSSTTTTTTPTVSTSSTTTTTVSTSSTTTTTTVPTTTTTVPPAKTPTSVQPGYDLVASDGGIFAFGAPFYGSMGGTTLNKPVVGMAATPDGKGYWLVASDGGIFAFGDARFQGSMGATTLNKPVVGMAVDPLTGGYWLVASDGGIFAFGAPFYGSMGGTTLNKPVVGMAALVTDPYVTGQTGADVSFPQCPVPSIGAPGIQAFPDNTGVAVVGVNSEATFISSGKPSNAFPDWSASYDPNPCLGYEFSLARDTGAQVSLYAVLWSAPTSSTDSQLFTGPKAACAGTSASTSTTAIDCQAYDWGYNIAKADLSYAAAQGAYSSLWWLDIEIPGGGEVMFGTDTQANDNVIAGAIAGFQGASKQVGIYSTYYQFPTIAGPTYSPGLPLWIPTYDTVGNLPWYCSQPSFFFGGGTPWLIQGKPTAMQAGSYTYNVDPDYAC